MAKSKPADRPWLSIQEAADHIGVSKLTIRRYIADGDLPAYQHAAVVRIKRTDLEAMLQPVNRSA